MRSCGRGRRPGRHTFYVQGDTGTDARAPRPVPADRRGAVSLRAVVLATCEAEFLLASLLDYDRGVRPERAGGLLCSLPLSLRREVLLVVVERSLVLPCGSSTGWVWRQGLARAKGTDRSRHAGGLAPHAIGSVSHRRGGPGTGGMRRRASPAVGVSSLRRPAPRCWRRPVGNGAHGRSVSANATARTLEDAWPDAPPALGGCCCRGRPTSTRAVLGQVPVGWRAAPSTGSR